MIALDKTELDVSQIFLVFMATIGDIDKTATALDIDPRIVDALAKQEGWLDKIRRISVMSKSEKPGDYERATNRALNYVQAHMFRQSMDRMLKYVRGLEGDAIKDVSTTADRNGVVRVSGRFWADMAAAMEKCHAMTYAALGDTATERKDAIKPGQPGSQPADLHAAIITALNASGCQDGEIKDSLITASQEVVKEIAIKATSAES
jgi:hypothetical protein